MGLNEIKVRKIGVVEQLLKGPIDPNDVPNPPAATGIVTLFFDQSTGLLSYKDENGVVTVFDGSNKALKDLSNLDPSTAINTSLVPDTHNLHEVGTQTSAWGYVWASEVRGFKFRHIDPGVDGNAEVDLSTGMLIDNAAVPSVNWNNRELKDSAGNNAFTWSDTQLDATNKPIINLADPTNAQDAATKNYVDTALGGGAQWVKVTKSYTDFSVAALTNSVALASLSNNQIVTKVIIKHNTAFSGGGATAVTIRLADNDGDITSNFNIFQTPGATVLQVTSSDRVNFNGLNLTMEVESDVNLDTLTAGSVDIYYKVENIE